MPEAHDPDQISSSDPAAPRRSASRPKRRGRTKRHRRVLVVLVSGAMAMVLAIGLGSVWFLRHLDDNVDYQDYDDQLTNRPDKARVADGPREPLNILVMGSDSRDGAGNNIDGLTGGGERSDTTLLFHLSADRTFAYGVSIPRDTIVDRPDCVAEDGSTIPGAEGVLWNEAFAVGGPACTMQQFEQLSGVRLDNYVKVDFNGFQDMVDAIDGVEVCIPEDISDPAHGIDIPAGTREIAGKEALSYVRARYTLGDGSDIGRIKRQQAFLAAMAGKVVSAGTLARVDRLLGFLDAATRSLQTDFGSVRAMEDVGSSFRSIGLDKIRFVTVPFQYSPEDPNHVEWLPEAEDLWRKVMLDKPLSGKVSSGVITAQDDVDGATAGTGDTKRVKGAATAEERESAGLCA